MRFEDQNAIAARHGAPDGKTFAKWLRSLDFLRNLAAHHARMWNTNVLEVAPVPAGWPEMPNARPFLYFCIMQQLLRTILPKFQLGPAVSLLLRRGVPTAVRGRGAARHRLQRRLGSVGLVGPQMKTDACTEGRGAGHIEAYSSGFAAIRNHVGMAGSAYALRQLPIFFRGYWVSKRGHADVAGRIEDWDERDSGIEVNESHLEETCLDWLASVGWTVAHGDDISPGGSDVCRERFSEIVLASRLREAVVRLNPALPADQADQWSRR